MMLIQASSGSTPLLFFMADSSDHITGKTGLTPTVVISKGGNSFGSPTGSVAELGNGWYYVVGNSTDTNMTGPIVLNATAAGADDFNGIVAQVVAFDPADSVRLGLTALPNAAAEAAGGLYTRGNGPGQINQSNSGEIDASVHALNGETAQAVKLQQYWTAVGYATVASVGSSTTATLNVGVPTVDDFFNGRELVVLSVSSGDPGQRVRVTDYDGTNRLITVDAPWFTDPTTLLIMELTGSSGGSGASAADVATAVFTDLLAGSDFSTTGSFGKLVKDYLDAAVSSRMATYTQPTGFLAANFTTAFAHLDADVSSRLAASSYTAPLSAAGTRSAVGLASANLDTQLAAIDADVLTRLASSSYTAPDNATIAAINTNVSTLLGRVTSTLFSGITSLAQWLGLLAGKQTGNSTARTEIRATGAGSGTFDETTDSQEAIRDRGDAAWTTATGFASATVAPSWWSAPLDAAGTRSAVGLASASLDSQLAAIAGYIDTEVSAIKAKTDNLPADPAGMAALASAHGAGSWATATGFAVAGDAMALTSAERNAAADALLARNHQGGSSTGRTVASCLQGIRNKIAFDVPSAGEFTVYAADDVTPAWTGTYTATVGASPVTTLDPG